MKRLLWASVLVACTDGYAVLGAEPIAVGTARHRVVVEDDGRAIRFVRGETTLVTLDAAAFQLGVADEILPGRAYDPVHVERRGDPADLGITYLAPTRARAFGGWDRATIDLAYEGGVTAHVTIASVTEARFSIEVAPSEGSRAVLVRVRVRPDRTEGLYGLGEAFDYVDNRGAARAMQIEPEPGIESMYNEAHVPVPLLVGTRGWGMFVASKRAGLFDVARKDPEVVEATFATGDPPEPLRVSLYGAEHPLDVLREYHVEHGFPAPPPPWALGPWIWRDESRDQAEVEDDIRQIRALDLATSGIWIDRPYARAVNTFDFDPARYPNPAAMIARARAAGLAVAVWHTPYVEPAAEPFASQVKSSGFFPPETGLPINHWSPPIDFTNPAARAFWIESLRRYTDMGITGFKLDYGEDVIPATLADQRNVYRFADGSTERTMHHGFSAAYHRAYEEAVPGEAFLLCRAAHWGEQTRGYVIWPGDLDATFTRHREPLPNGENGVGGLPASVVAGLSLSASGFPYFGADTGGYRHSPPDKELYIRWFEQTALSTVMQVGDSSSQPPWLFTPDNGRDAETLDLYREYARLHLRLFPYEWTYARRAATDGRPITRPLGLAHPELEVHPSDEYLFGDDLLVAPVLRRGDRTRVLFAPRGTWFDWWDGRAYVLGAPGTISVDAPLAKLPLFLREGAIVPMLRPTIDTLSPATDPEVDSFANDPGILWVLHAPGPSRTFELWDGTRIARADDGTIELSSGAVFDRGFVLEMIAVPEPREVLRSGAPVPRATSLDPVREGWTWQPERSGTLRVKLERGFWRVAVR